MGDPEGDLVNYVRRLLFCLLLIAGADLSHAQEPGDVHPSLTDKFVLDMGVFFPDRNFRIHVDGSIAGRNPNIDFADEFASTDRTKHSQSILVGASNEFRRESVKAEFPLPNVGIWYRYSLSPKWALRSRFDYLSVDIGDYNGSLVNGSLGFNYRLFENFGVGLSYNIFELDLGVTRTDWGGEVKSRYEGPYVSASAYW